MIKLSASKISSKDHIAVSKALKGNYLGMGIYTRSFEHELKRYIGGNRNVICVNSGTAALHLACESIDIKKGEEIIVPSITYVASFQAIQASGAVPVACDIDKNTGFIDAGMMGGKRAGFSATAMINRKDFGLNWNRKLDKGGLLVGNEVTIELKIQAVAST